MRLACIYVPALALQAVLRRAPELRGAPAALLARVLPKAAGTGRGRVLRLSAEAARRGRRRAGHDGGPGPGDLPRAAVAHGSPRRRRRGGRVAALADVGYALPAPRVEQEPGARVLRGGGSGAALLPRGEAAVAQAVQAQAARVGLEARVAIAGGKAVARVATRAHEMAIVPRRRRGCSRRRRERFWRPCPSTCSRPTPGCTRPSGAVGHAHGGPDRGAAGERCRAAPRRGGRARVARPRARRGR